MTEHQSNASSRAQHGAREDREEQRTDTVPTGRSAESQPQDDVLSDPARDDRLGSDWADEGGATPSGPATSTSAGEEQGDDPKREARPEREDDDEGGRSSGTSQPPISLDPPD